MLTEEEIINYALTFDGAYAKYPYGKSPLVLSTFDSHEFCELYEGIKPLHIVVKCDPAKAEIIRQKYKSIQPGYRCNKKYWNSVVIDGSVPDSEIKTMIEDSYTMACKMKKKKDIITTHSDQTPEASPGYKFEF